VVELGVRIAAADTRGGINEDRLDRLEGHAEALVAIARRHGCTRIDAEAISLPRAGGVNAAASQFLTWGMLVGVARALGLPRPRQIAPKAWERAVVPDDDLREREGYDAIERALAAFVGEQGPAAEQLAAIPRGQRTHALDAVGVGVFAAIRGDGAGGRRR
jgi:hypothetical protein